MWMSASGKPAALNRETRSSTSAGTCPRPAEVLKATARRKISRASASWGFRRADGGGGGAAPRGAARTRARTKPDGRSLMQGLLWGRDDIIPAIVATGFRRPRSGAALTPHLFKPASPRPRLPPNRDGRLQDKKDPRS